MAFTRFVTCDSLLSGQVSFNVSMRNFILIIILLAAVFFKTSSQENTHIPTKVFFKDFKKLVELNSHIESLVVLSGKEAVNILDNATASQIIEISTPYINSGIINTKSLCWSMLNEALFKKAKSETQKQEIVEIFCKNYLSNESDLQMIDNTLLRLKAKDFNVNSRKYIAALIEILPRFDYSTCAKLLAVAQIKESIPVLWKIAKKNIQTMERRDLDVLAALARMNEKEAGIILCNYYNSKRNNEDYKHVFLAEHMAFSLDKNVLECMIADFKTIDTSITFWEYDSGYWPSSHLAGWIATMIGNYSYPNEEFMANPKQLLEWLNQKENTYQLEGK
jgi:hypothetical protein